MDGSETWEGEAGLLDTPPKECDLVRAWVTNMAGAIAQVKLKPESLVNELLADFESEWIEPCLRWNDQPDESDLYQRFASIGWGSDYEPFYKYRFDPRFYNGRFHRSKPDNWQLFKDSEQILYRAFSDSLVQSELLKTAKHLEAQPISNEGTQLITREQFLSEGRALLQADAWDELRRLNLGNP